MTTQKSPIIPDSYDDLLASKAVAHIATIGPHGEPQNNPVWFGWDGEYLKFSQTKTRQKLHNLQRNPQIALSMTDPENPYRYLEVRGVVARIEDDPENAFIDKMAQKCIDQPRYPWHRPGDERVVVVVEPRHISSMG